MSCCLLAHKYYRYLQQGHHNNMCLRSFFTRRSHPATFPHTASFRCPPYRQQATTCLPVRTRATRGRLRSSTRPNLDAHETGRAHSRSRDSRRGEPREAGSGDETEDGAPYHHPDPPTKRVDSRLAQKRRRTNLHRIRGRLDANSRQTYTSDHHGGIPRSPASSAPAPAPRMRFGTANNRAEILTRASLAHSVPATNSSTAVQHHRQHCRGHLFCFQKILVFPLLACPLTQRKFPLSRTHGLLRRLRTIRTA